MLEDENLEENDFSHFYDKKPEPAVSTAPVPINQPRSLSRRMVWSLIVIFILVIALVISVILARGRSAKIVVPSGYKLINTNTAPPKLEKIK
jgi:hypothetical protein